MNITLSLTGLPLIVFILNSSLFWPSFQPLSRPEIPYARWRMLTWK